MQRLEIVYSGTESLALGKPKFITLADVITNIGIRGF